MIKFQHDGKLYRLKFFHDRDMLPVNRMDGTFGLASQGGQTTASIDVEEGGKWAATGYEGTAFCHPQDNFCKETGRRVSLADLTKEMDLYIDSRAFRKAINTAYWTR